MTNQLAGRFKRRKIGTCPSGCITFAYDLPVRLDESILPFLQPLGKLALPFEKTSVLKLECPGFTVSGIKRLKEVRAVLKKGTIEKDLFAFEEALDNWLSSRPK
jgi:hypothetical protein